MGIFDPAGTAQLLLNVVVMKQMLGLFLTAMVVSAAAIACGADASDADIKESANTAAPGAGEPGGTSTEPGPEGSQKRAETTTGLPCDVDQILKTRCQTCHASQPQFGANTALVTWDDLQKPGPGANASKKVIDLVKVRIHSENGPMPPSPKPRLEAKELAVIDGWIADGAKASPATCNNEVPPDGVKPLSCKPDTVLKSAKPFTMQAGSAQDQYVCFGVDIDLAKKRHVIGLAPKVDNKQIVHHILLFQAPSTESPEPFACAAFGSGAWKLVAGWAPGGNNLELPPEAGLPQEKGKTHWVLQIHYNNTVAKSGTDNSGYEICTTENLRPNDAGVLAFGSTSFTIPPRSTHAIKCDYTLGAQFANKTFYNASPHMHTRGDSMMTERLPKGGGAAEKVFEQKAFSFEAQANYPISTKVNAGDVMRTHCKWKNPGDTSIGFGEGTNDEMCFDFIGYYPAIPDLAIGSIPIFTWITPSLTAACSPE